MKPSKSDKKLIQKAIKGLPAMQSKTQTETRFSMVRPGAYIKSEVPKIANHKTNAEKIFSIEGMPGVNKYCEDVREKYRLFYEQRENGAQNSN